MTVGKARHTENRLREAHSKDPGRGYLPPEKDLTDISGDPGVGALLADPDSPVIKTAASKNPEDGPPSPDPEQPTSHGDWAPNRSWRGVQKK